ncbi:MAG TPA: response regulator [Stellaceae bacterium]|jgi:DNA-binding NtrC family response regulator
MVEPTAGRRDSPHGKPRVLVVDDDKDVLALAATVLKDCGYEVLQCHDGRQALDVLRIRHDAIDLLFTDVVMPGMNGFDLADAAKRICPALKVLYTTGFASVPMPLAAKRHGKIIPKPWRPDDLCRQIEATLEGGDSGVGVGKASN